MDDDLLRAYGEAIPSQRLRWIDVAIVGFDLARRITGAIEVVLTSAEQLLCQQANYMTDQAVFADEARRQIESIIEEE